MKRLSGWDAMLLYIETPNKWLEAFTAQRFSVMTWSAERPGGARGLRSARPFRERNRKWLQVRSQFLGQAFGNRRDVESAVVPDHLVEAEIIHAGDLVALRAEDLAVDFARRIAEQVEHDRGAVGRVPVRSGGQITSQVSPGKSDSFWASP